MGMIHPSKTLAAVPRAFSIFLFQIDKKCLTIAFAVV
jgi:hypothetical protein